LHSSATGRQLQITALYFSDNFSAAIITGVMARITPRQRRLAKFKEDIRWFKEEQEFKLLCDNDLLDDLDLLLEADLKDRYNHLCSQSFFARKEIYRCLNCQTAGVG
jgi:hypothetical protein